MKYRITLVEEPQPEGGYSVFCDDIDGCCSQGDTRAEAIANIGSAIHELLEYLHDENLPVIPREPWAPDEFEGAASVEQIEIEQPEPAYA